MSLKANTVTLASLDDATRRSMLSLMQVCYEGVTSARFFADLDEKQFVILLYAARTGELAGFSTVRVAEELLDRRKVEIVFSGDTVIHPDHWGAKTLQAAFVRFIVSRKLKNPARPVFWLLLSAGYKTYLLMVNYFPRSLPNRNELVPQWKPFLDRIATGWFGNQYDAARGVLRFTGPHYRVKEGVSPIDRETAARPDIAFYVGRNPGHVDGDELVCIGELRLRDLVRAFARIGWNQARGAIRKLRTAGQTAGSTPRLP